MMGATVQAPQMNGTGPAKAYEAVAKVAAPGVQGPAAVAAGRAVLAGKTVVKNGKLYAPITARKYQIVFVTAELAPYSKTGGLGEAIEGLSIALAGFGHRVMVIAPRYDQYANGWDTDFWSSVDMS